MLVDRVASALSLAVLAVSVLGIFAAPWIIYASAPGFSATPEKFELTVAMLRITFPYIVFISLVSLAGGILNTWSRFAVPAITPTLLNVSFIFCALVLAPLFPSAGAGAGLGGARRRRAAACAAVALPRKNRHAAAPAPGFLRSGGAPHTRLMGPAVFGVSIAQVSLLINTIFASFLANGSVSWLYYADR